MKTYRTRFLLALIGNIVLAVVLVGLWLHYRAAKPPADSETKKENSAAQDSMGSSMPASPASTEVLLVPVQISPQRLQSIGVKTGKVERKSVADEIRTTGNIAVEEWLPFSDVLVRGVRKHFLDIAGKPHLDVGQPSFVILHVEVGIEVFACQVHPATTAFRSFSVRQRFPDSALAPRPEDRRTFAQEVFRRDRRARCPAIPVNG
jgi:hypothetical protein